MTIQSTFRLLIVTGLICSGLVMGGVRGAIPVSGCVKNPLTVDDALLSSTPHHTRLAKIFDRGQFVVAVEASGISLKELLQRAEIAKKSDDGFNRELDLLIEVTGAQGEKAVLSWGEVFFNPDPGAFLICDSFRRVIPLHGGPSAADDPSHPIKMPKGNCLVVPRDRYGWRLVQDIVRIEVCPSGVTVPKAWTKRTATWVQWPQLVDLDGKSRLMNASDLRGMPSSMWSDATVGLGRGYHGTHEWKGNSLAVLVRRMASTVDIARTAVLITASDGYRCILSAAELLDSPNGDNWLLSDNEDGKPLPKDAGRFKTVGKSDYFVDRDVRLVAEIRLLKR